MTPIRQAAQDLGAAVDALDARIRLHLARQTIGAGTEPQTRAFWMAIHMLTEGATTERTDHLVSVLEVAGPGLCAAVLTVADEAAAPPTPLTPFWRALRDLVRAIGQPPPMTRG